MAAKCISGGYVNEGSPQSSSGLDGEAIPRSRFEMWPSEPEFVGEGVPSILCNSAVRVALLGVV